MENQQSWFGLFSLKFQTGNRWPGLLPISFFAIHSIFPAPGDPYSAELVEWKE
jgi:hypothetical protein